MGHGATANPPGGRSGSGAAPPNGATELAEELARVLELLVDAKVAALLDDRERAAELAARMSAASDGQSAALADDFAEVVSALALIAERLGELEERLAVLAEVTSTVARSLDELRPRAGEGEEPGGDGGPGGTLRTER